MAATIAGNHAQQAVEKKFRELATKTVAADRCVPVSVCSLSVLDGYLVLF